MIAAEQYATRLVVPASQRMPATRWSSHKDIAAKALKKLAGPHLPASLTKLEQAVKRAHAAYDKAETAAREQQRAERQPAEPSRRRHRRRARRGPRRRRVARAPPAGGPTRHPMVARPGGRAGGGGSARHRGGPQTRREPTMARRFNRKPLTDEPSATRAARPTASASSRPPARC